MFPFIHKVFKQISGDFNVQIGLGTEEGGPTASYFYDLGFPV